MHPKAAAWLVLATQVMIQGSNVLVGAHTYGLGSMLLVTSLALSLALTRALQTQASVLAHRVQGVIRFSFIQIEICVCPSNVLPRHLPHLWRGGVCVAIPAWLTQSWAMIVVGD